MFSFAHPTFLWLAPLALVPVILHLLSRIAPQSLRFPTTRFLHNSPMPLQGRRRWQDVLLMIMRTALIATIIFLLARPSWKTSSIQNAPEKEGIVAILDISPSMCACINELRNDASSLPDSTIFLSTSNQPLTPSNWTVENTVPNISKALLNAANYLSNFPQDARTLHIFSDLQSTNWSSEVPNMPEGTKVVVHSNEAKVLNNWSVLSTKCEFVGDNQLRVLTTCRNWGEEAETRTVELKLDDMIYRQELYLAPNSSAPALFLVKTPNNSHAKVSITPGDAFSFDDTKDFWATPEPPHPILAVFPAEDEKICEELEFFAMPALLAEPDDAPPRYAITTLDVSGLQYADISSQAAIFLFGAADRLNDESAEALRNYVENGGVLFAIPGASPLAGWRFLQKAGLAPHGTATFEKHPTGIGALNTTDALYTLFPEKHPSDLHLFRINNHIKVSSTENTYDVMLQTMENTPALIHRVVEKGQVFIFTFGFDTQSSDFPLAKSFLPLLRELLLQGLGSRSEILTLICGDSTPDIKSLDGTAAEIHIDTSEPGLVKWENHLVEIGISPQESSIHYRKAQDITRALAGHSDNLSTKADTNIFNLTMHCAFALLIILVLEALLSIKRYAPKK